MNKVLLVGHLASDPEVRASQKGTYVATMRLATNTYAGKAEDGSAKVLTQFHNLVAFGKAAEFSGSHLQKGRLDLRRGQPTDELVGGRCDRPEALQDGGGRREARVCRSETAGSRSLKPGRKAGGRQVML